MYRPGMAEPRLTFPSPTLRTYLGADAPTDIAIHPRPDGTASVITVSHHKGCGGSERVRCGCSPISTSDTHTVKLEDSELEAGDVVQLNSDRQRSMVIEQIARDEKGVRVRCAWFAADGCIYRDVFTAATITKVQGKSTRVDPGPLIISDRELVKSIRRLLEDEPTDKPGLRLVFGMVDGNKVSSSYSEGHEKERDEAFDYVAQTIAAQLGGA